MSTAATLDEVYEDLSPMIGEVTDEHVETFWRDGLVVVPGFVKAELCEQVLSHFMEWSGIRWREWPSDPTEQEQFVAAVDAYNSKPKLGFAIRQEDPWMFNYVTQRKFGEAAARFLKVPSVRMQSETLHVKQPASSGRSTTLNWHQDFPFIPIDRAEAVQTWIALVDITPDMGPMHHLIGSHRSLPGGMLSIGGEKAEEIYSELFDQYPMTELDSYSQGTAVFHHCLTWHMSPPNSSDRLRWAMSSYRVSARSRYTGQFNHNTDNLGLKPGDLFDHPNFPLVYP